MKFHFPTLLFSITFILTSTGSGCASLSHSLTAKVLAWTGMGESDPESGESAAEDDGGDPVAAAAMRLRRPASVRATDSEPGERGWGRPTYWGSTAETIEAGMGMEDVEAVWGAPTHVDTAGDPRDGNQRWVYYSGLSSRYGLGTKKTVYFESGRVAGWKRAN